MRTAFLARPMINAQPLQRPVLNWNNALTQGLLLSAYNCPQDAVGPPLNYVTGKVGTAIATARAPYGVSAKTKGGWLSSGQNNTPINVRIAGAVAFNGTTSQTVFPLNLQPFRQITLAFWYRRMQSGADTNGFVAGPAALNTWFISPSTASAGMYIGVNTSGTNRFYGLSAVANMPLGEWHHHVIGLDRDVTVQVAFWYIDGWPANFSASGGSLTAGVDWVTNGNLNIGSVAGSGPSAQEIAGLLVWRRAFTAEDIYQLYRYGWNMFKQPQRQFIFPAAPSSGVPSRWFLMQ